MSAPTSSKITVQGSGSRLIVTGAAQGHHSLMIGEVGPGELAVRASGQVEVLQGGAALACCANASGTGTGQIIVEGENSQLIAKYIDFRASGGSSAVTIRDRGVIHATDAMLDSLIWPAAVATIDVEVADAGSMLRIDGRTLTVTGSHWDMGGTARLRIENGGEVRLAGNLQLLGDAPGRAYMSVNDNGVLNVSGVM